MDLTTPRKRAGPQNLDNVKSIYDALRFDTETLGW